MTPYANEGLAHAVRRLREGRGMTQERLGREAGYRTGAGVAISRLESGLLRPSPARFAGIAAALGLRPDELEALARAPVAPDRAAPAAPAGRAKAPPGQKELDARRRRIEEETGARTRAITELSDAFNQAHDRARDGYFARLVELAARIDGAPVVDPARLPDDDAPDVDAADRRGAEAGRATARERARRGAGRAMVLAGIVAVPVAILAAGGLANVRRDRRQRQEYDAQLDEAEAQLAATRPGIEALQDLLPRAGETLDYVATHAGHALQRWGDQLGTGPLSWDALRRADQRRYQDFIDVADAQVAISTLDFQGLLVARGRDQAQLIQLADDVLRRSHEVVTARV